ncbi:YbaB/EbfC family nucleoid-associated protein [Mucisphaera sp.]|uniref:YbaB/EbfC family nucleoid-associated protein n=1 Tax=Mucisphaera sp. TaxID=2913024 RepID=UPI003D150AB3
MFEQMKMMQQLGKLMANKDELKAKAEALKEELGRRTVEAEAGGGVVRVVVSGHLKVVEIRFDPAVLAASGEADQRMLEDLTAEAVNAGMAKAQAMIREAVKEAMGGLDLPGLENLLPG